MMRKFKKTFYLWSLALCGVLTIYLLLPGKQSRQKRHGELDDDKLFVQRISEKHPHHAIAAKEDTHLERKHRYLNESNKQEVKYTITLPTDNNPHVHLHKQFSSLHDAQAYMETMDIKHSQRIVIWYPNFTQKLPLFIDDSDSELFLRSNRNRENMKPPTAEQLVGVVEIIQDGTFMSRDFDCGFKGDYDFMREPRTPSIGKSYDILAPIIVPHAFEFQHFYDGTLPKIIQAFPLLQKPGVKIILEAPEHPNINLVLDKLGLTEEKIILHPQNDRKSVYYAKYMIMTCIAPPLHPLLWKNARDRLDVPKSLPFPKSDNSVMLLTRAGAVKPGRNIFNEKAVTKFLTQRYGDQFKIFHGGYNLQEAIHTFSRVKIIIGVHGGAFYNMNYAPYNTNVIEIGPIKAQGGDMGLPHAKFWPWQRC